MQAPGRYTVELVRPAEGWTQLQELTERARQTSLQMQQEGIRVRFLRSIFVPEEDACFFLYEGPSAEAVSAAAARAALTVDQRPRAVLGQSQRPAT